MKTCSSCEFLTVGKYGLFCRKLRDASYDTSLPAFTAAEDGVLFIRNARNFSCSLYTPVLLPKESFEENCHSGYYVAHPEEFEEDALKFIESQGIPPGVSQKIYQSLQLSDSGYIDLWYEIHRMVQIWKD